VIAFLLMLKLIFYPISEGEGPMQFGVGIIAGVGLLGLLACVGVIWLAVSLIAKRKQTSEQQIDHEMQ
jgi:hypothetical protein